MASLMDSTPNWMVIAAIIVIIVLIFFVKFSQNHSQIGAIAEKIFTPIKSWLENPPEIESYRYSVNKTVYPDGTVIYEQIKIPIV